ncbi:MAG: DUF1579 family protein [Planctomycetota bacterium]
MKLTVLLVAVFVAVMGFVSPLVLQAQDEAPAEPAAPAVEVEADPMAVLQAYAGEWSCEAEWSWGATIVARNVYEPVFDGKHMRARTYVSDNGGPEYLRYETLFSFNAQTQRYVYTTIAYEGSVETGEMELREDGFHIEAEQPDGQGGTLVIRQFISRVEGDRYDWRVMMQNPSGDWVAVMDDTWERVGGADE